MLDNHSTSMICLSANHKRRIQKPQILYRIQLLGPYDLHREQDMWQKT